MTNDHCPTNTMKSFLQSKTIWLQIVAVLCMFIPAVKGWFAANPVEFVAALGALNVLVRFCTSGKVTVFADATGSQSQSGGTSGMTLLLACATAAGLGVLSLPSCTAASSIIPALRGIPIRTYLLTDYGTASYSSKSGIGLTVDRRSRK